MSREKLGRLQTVKPWWLQSGPELAQAIWDHIEALEENQILWFDRYLKHEYMYRNDGVEGLDWRLRDRPGRHAGWGMMTMNATQSVVDTVAAIIAQNRARPIVQTDGADWSDQNKARKFSRFLEGQWNLNKVHVEELRVAYDGLKHGTGAMKVYECDGKVGIEHVPIYDLRWDEREGRNGEIRSIHQLRWVDAYWLAAQDFVDGDEKALELISEQMSKANECRLGFDDQEHGTVLVVESWRIGGKHTWTIDGHTLFEEDWTMDRLPFVFFRWREQRPGFAGQGLVQELVPLQIELNRLNKVIQANQKMFGNPMWLVAQNSGISAEDINGVPGQVLTHRPGQFSRPELVVPQTVAAEVYAQEEKTYTRMFEKAGVSRHSAFGTKDPSLHSGIAIREAVDVETQRFAIPSQMLQDFRVELAELTLQVAKRVYQRQGKLKVTYNEGDFVRTIDWSEADITDKPYHITVQTASILSRTMAGRKQDVIDFVQAGIFSLDDARKLINHPDVTREMDIQNSAAEHAAWVIDQLSDGKIPSVEPDMNLQLTIQQVIAERLRAIRGNAPAEIQENMLRWTSRAQFVLSQSAMAQQAQMMAAQMGQQGMSQADTGDALNALAGGAPSPV